MTKCLQRSIVVVLFWHIAPGMACFWKLAAHDNRDCGIGFFGNIGDKLVFLFCGISLAIVHATLPNLAIQVRRIKMKAFGTFFMALLFSGIAAAASLEEDVNRYIQIFNGDKSLHAEAVESLAWMGISDPRLFDIIERRVLDEAQTASNDRHEKHRFALYIRALGFSGQLKYQATLSRFASDRSYERYAKTALADMAQYQKWNPVISNRASFDARYSDEVNRILIMLKSDDFQLKKIGAKRIYFKNREEVLLDTLTAQIRATYMLNNRELSDSIAWMVKALGNARLPQYRPLLQEVTTKAPDSKVADYAKKALENRIF